MYYEYFGLKQPPFRITPDTNLFFPGANRGAILEALIYAVGNGEGIVKVVGEVGSGKTMLCRMLEQELPDRVEVVYLANPSLSPENILHVIAFELKLPVSADTPRVEVMRALQEYLLARHAENRQVVVFVEEAQGMPIATLEEIRLLSNLETRQNKLLQIVLFGQPELDEKLSLPEIRQLKERITYSFQLPPFNPVEIRDYLNSRVRACGCRAAELFSAGAVHAIAVYSQGLVRRINIIADKSLLAAYADTTIQVSKAHVAKAAKDSEFSSPRPPKWLPLAAAAGTGALVVALAAAWWMNRDTGAIPAEAPAAAAAPVISAAPGLAPPTVAVAPEPEPQPEMPAPAATAPVESPALAESTPAPVQEDLPEPAPAPEMEPEIEPAPMATPAPSPFIEGEQASPPTGGQAHDLPLVFEWQAEGEPSMSVTELARLQQMISSHPPEEVPPAGPAPGDLPCELCSAIVYRPLPESESL